MDNHNHKNATLYDVARLAGVSYQTVSRVVNNQPRVSEATRLRVQVAIRDLNYRPSYAAQRLAANRSKALAMITFGVGNYGPAEMLLNMDQTAHAAGYELTSAYVDARNGEGIALAVDRLLRTAVDGIVLFSPVESPYYDTLLDLLRATPIVHVDIEPNAHRPSVVVDQYTGSATVTRHLLELGHRKLCEIRGPENWFGARSRHTAFVDTLAQAGLEAVASVVGDWSPQSGYKAAKYLLDHFDFTAIVVANDHMALGVLSALAERGIALPEQVSVVGFDNVEESAFYVPALTTVQQDFVGLGMRALDYLLKLIDNPEIPIEQHTLDTKLIVRKSTAPPPR